MHRLAVTQVSIWHGGVFTTVIIPELSNIDCDVQFESKESRIGFQ